MTSRVFSLQLGSIFPSCVCDFCRGKDDCELKLDGFPPQKVILNVDCVIPSKDAGRRSDYVVVVDEVNVTFLPIEFKSTRLDLTRIKKQLEGSIRFFREHLPNNFKCYPVLVSKGLQPQERKNLLRIKIKHGSGRKKIKHVVCDKSLRWGEVKRQA